jgi:hypothetical protein
MATISGNLEFLRDNGNKERPWLSLLMDAYSRRILAAYLTFDSTQLPLLHDGFENLRPTLWSPSPNHRGG